jgi:hypothetical protein
MQEFHLQLPLESGVHMLLLMIIEVTKCFDCHPLGIL